MKIENNGISSLSTQSTEAAQRAERKSSAGGAGRVQQGHDKAELSESARLLAKARAQMDSQDSVRSERLDEIRQQVNNGDYTIQVEELARRLMVRHFKP